jgi:hypothetical protein
MSSAPITEALAHWGRHITFHRSDNAALFQRAEHENGWFTKPNIALALDAITQDMLEAGQLAQWLARYPDLSPPAHPKSIGLVMAGNLPAAGFHDLLCVLASGHRALVKLSSKDKLLLPWMAELLEEIAPELGKRIQFTERLQGFDAVIATGSNNSARYFRQYFGRVPHIIRKNRNSLAVLSGSESPEELEGLGHDIFDFFGLGCRNVSKIYLPAGYDIPQLMDALEPFATLADHNKYLNNYEYQRSLLLLNKVPHFASNFLLLKEDTGIASPLATVYYEHYSSMEEVRSTLEAKEEDIQCVVTHLPEIEDAVPFGQSQRPRLWDYADRVDTMRFLAELS